MLCGEVEACSVPPFTLVKQLKCYIFHVLAGSLFLLVLNLAYKAEIIYREVYFFGFYRY